MAYAETCLLLKLASPTGKGFGLSGCTASPSTREMSEGSKLMLAYHAHHMIYFQPFMHMSEKLVISPMYGSLTSC